MPRLTFRHYLWTVLTSLLLQAMHSQISEKMTMSSFVPKSKSYDIYYPKHFLLQEDAEGIVNMYDTVSRINITLSIYPVRVGTTDKQLIVQMNDFVKSAFGKELKESDWNSYNTKFPILIESQFSVETTNWVWYALVDKGKLMMISLISRFAVTEEQTRLLKYMIDSIVVSG